MTTEAEKATAERLAAHALAAIRSGQLSEQQWRNFRNDDWLAWLRSSGASPADVDAAANSFDVLGSFKLLVLAGTGDGIQSGVPGPAGDVLDVVTGPLKPIAGLVEGATRLVAELLDPNNWRRLGLILAGALLVILGLVFLAREYLTPPGAP